MNCWAWACGLAKTDTAATAAAINLAFMRIILPLFFRREIGRTKACGQPIQTTHARAEYAGLGCPPAWQGPAELTDRSLRKARRRLPGAELCEPLQCFAAGRQSLCGGMGRPLEAIL